jgi:hypothetical protein
MHAGYACSADFRLGFELLNLDLSESAQISANQRSPKKRSPKNPAHFAQDFTSK